MQPRTEQRLSPREPSTGRVWVRWSDQSGTTLGGRFCALDVSDNGLAVLLERRLDPFSFVHIESKELKMIGLAVVRHCSRKGMSWKAGLQFRARPGKHD